MAVAIHSCQPSWSIQNIYNNWVFLVDTIRLENDVGVAGDGKQFRSSSSGQDTVMCRRRVYFAFRFLNLQANS